jgi:hypothetical protein
MSTNAEIGISRKQRVFALVESVFGTLQFPVGTTDFIRPAGNAVINQNPAFTDSEELQNTLDVLDRFQSALPAGKWSIPMYMRPSGTLGGAPQGSALFRSLQGSIAATVTAAITSDPGATAATVNIKTVSGALPEVGVILVGAEKIRYTGITRVSRSATTATLTGCTRAFVSSTAATHAADAVVTLKSIFYKQKVDSPSLSIWVETDHFIQGISGASVDEATIEVTNEGAVKVSFSGQGMQMVYAGTSALAASALATNTVITVDDASLFSVGAHVYNETKGSSHATITAISIATNKITLAHACGASWATDNVIKGYLPANCAVIGDPVEAKDTLLKISGVEGVIKSGSIGIKAAKKYITDEIGTTKPEDFLEEARDITSQFKVYFRKEDAKYFTDGLASEENSVHFTFGDTAGSMIDVFLPRVMLEVPAIEFSAPAVELSIPIKAIGTEGEDSCEISVC